MASKGFDDQAVQCLGSGHVSAVWTKMYKASNPIPTLTLPLKGREQGGVARERAKPNRECAKVC